MPIATMSIQRHRPFLLASLLLCVGWLNEAQAGDLFSTLPGAWSGTGTVVKDDDTTEPLRCKAKYSLTPSGTIVHLELRCAADSYRMNFVTDLVNQSGTLAGTWKEIDRQVAGPVSGKIDGDVISTHIKGTAFEADVVITTHEGKQTILLTSGSGNYAKAVKIALKAD